MGPGAGFEAVYVKLLADASNLQQGMQQGGQSVEKFGQTVQRVGQQVQGTTSQMGRMGAEAKSLTDIHIRMGNVFDFMGGAGGPLARLGSLMQGHTSVLGALGAAFGGVTGMIGGFISQMLSMAAGMTVFNLFETAASQVRMLGEEMIATTSTAQRFMAMWQFQFGGMGPNYTPGPGSANARTIAGFLPNFALDIPFNLMEVMQGIGPMAQMGLNAKGVQRFAPLIADIASTHTSIFGGGGPLPFNYAALAIMEAAITGNARRMFMELQMSPRELTPYGLKFADEGGHLGGQILNPQQFFPALEAWAKDHNIQGAAKYMAKNTWWGLTSNVQDWMNKFEMRLGGTNVPTTQQSLDYEKTGAPAGTMDLRAGTPMKILQDSLKDLLDWVQGHESQIYNFLDKLGNLGGNALTMLRKGFEGFAQGLKASGIGDVLQKDLENAISWLGDPANQDKIKKLATILGEDLGGALKNVHQDVVDLKNALGDLWGAFTPEQQKLIKDTFSVGLTMAGTAMQFLVQQITSDVELIGDIVSLANDLAHGDWGAAGADAQRILGELGRPIKQQPGDGPGWNTVSGVKPINTTTGRPDHDTGHHRPGSGPVGPEYSAAYAPAGGGGGWASMPAGGYGSGGSSNSVGGSDAAGLLGAPVAAARYGGVRVTNHFHGMLPEKTVHMIDEQNLKRQREMDMELRIPGVGRFNLAGPLGF